MQTNVSDENRSRRRSKVLGFIIAEAVAILVLVLAGAFEYFAHPVNSTVIAALNIVMIVAAVGVATIPIFFFAIGPVLPRSRR
ncbi:MAG TPA: hypothetical protein VM940_08255 [Chthoniobacterales bacterium]|nr:hypothetical protein [Chthoniobacterales bacterium]